MHTRRLNRIARYLGSAGLYKEAYQIRKVAQGELEDEQRIELDKEQESLETNEGAEFEDLFPSSLDDEDMDEGMDEDDMDSSLSEYLDEEGMEPAGEERFDDEDFDPDMEAYESMPHDDDDEELYDLFDDGELDGDNIPTEDEENEYEEMIADRAFRRGTREY
jgi:hypothetical protein